MHEKYLQVVLNETERLTKLTNGLLTLNSLGTKGILLNRTDFDINESIRGVAATLSRPGRKRQITIELVLTGSQLYVNADADPRIQQVLYNPVDNAVKFLKGRQQSALRPQSGAADLRPRQGLRHRHSQEGPEADLRALLQDRPSRAKDKKGTGLLVSRSSRRS